MEGGETNYDILDIRESETEKKIKEWLNGQDGTIKSNLAW